MRATAAIFEKLHAPFAVGDVEVDDALRPGEALVRIVASGVCHTDALARDGDFPFPAPGVVGHEGSGIVAAVGPGGCAGAPRATGGGARGGGAIWRVPRPPVGSSVVIYGAGAVGLAAVMAARLTGATTIIAVDRVAARLKLARELGATETINVAAPGTDPVAAVTEI